MKFKKNGNNFALFCLSAMFIFMGSSCLKQKVSLIIYNAHIYSLNSNQDSFDAMVVDGNKICELGNYEELSKNYSSSQTMNAQGSYIFPGFFDGHTHYSDYAITLSQINLYGTNSFNEVLKKVAQYVAANPQEDFIIGHGWDQNLWSPAQFPNNKILNDLYPNKAIILNRIDGHAALVNQRAIELAHLDTQSFVEGGLIQKNNGSLTGILIDKAIPLVSKIVPKETYQTLLKKMQIAEEICLGYGLTAMSICGITVYDALLLDSMYKNNSLNIRLQIFLSDNPESYSFLFSNTFKSNPKLKINGIKMYMDGALGSRGASLMNRYSDDNSSGFLLQSFYHYDSIITLLKNSPFQLCTHAIGDSANRVILQLYNQYLTADNDRRWRVEHAQVVNADDVHYFKDRKIIPSVQPLHATEDMFWAPKRLGSQRLNDAYRLKSLYEQNGWIILGTDFPAGVPGPNPLRTYLSAVYRLNDSLQPIGGFRVEEALTPLETMLGMTYWPAKGAFWEQEIGSLEIGKKADFIILDKNLMELKAPQVLTTAVKATYIDGKLVWNKATP